MRIEQLESRLRGLDARTQPDGRLGAPPKFTVDPKSRTEPDERLTIEEQRHLLFLIRKMRGEPERPVPPLAPAAS